MTETEALRTAMRVIVADDDSDIRQLMEISVRHAGLELAAAVSDGTAAWEAISTLRPGVVVLDVSMPGLTGLQLCRLIRQDANLANLRVLLLSASASQSSRHAAMDAGADDYLLKPFSPKNLAAILRKAADAAV